ncbi:MAG: topoisomerase DNA-binding C4 zinc finger domain-containing protein [Lachnospiraceae bacterium]|nr:topoisomerase DNA-binding C4 zinc finger domain-containing protein [Lachnospiraceae bacterium]
MCGGILKYRTSRYGSFYGCSNYPRCTYTEKM